MVILYGYAVKWVGPPPGPAPVNRLDVTQSA
jgi:hypothetical protein